MGISISFHSTEKRYILLNFFYILSMLIIAIIPIIIEKLYDCMIIELDEHMLVFRYFVNYIGFSLFIIPEIIIKYKSSSKSNKTLSLKYKYKLKDIVIFGLFSLIMLINHFSEIFLEIYESTKKIEMPLNLFNFFYLAIITISFIVSKKNYYKHQYISIIIIVFLGVIKDILKLTQTQDENFIFKDFILLLFLNIIQIISLSFYLSYSKILIDKYLFSPYKLCYLFGFMNATIFLIISFILSYIPCNSEFCLLKYNNEKYFDNLYYFFNLNLTQKIGYFIYSFNQPISFIFIYIIIEKYTTCHILLPYQIVYVLQSIGDVKDLNNKYYFIQLFIFVVEIFMTLVFLEIIELKFCGLNAYIKKNIEKRALEDVKDSLDKKKEYLK